MIIERIEYVVLSGDIIPKRRIVSEQVDEHYYIVKCFTPVFEGTEVVNWKDALCSCRFNGREHINGVLKYAHDGVHKRFEMMIEYEGYTEVK